MTCSIHSRLSRLVFVVFLLLAAPHSYAQEHEHHHHSDPKISKAEKWLSHHFDEETYVSDLYDPALFNDFQNNRIGAYFHQKISSLKSEVIHLWIDGEIKKEEVNDWFESKKPFLISAFLTDQPGKGKGKPLAVPKAPNGPCTNMDFESCDFTGWNLFQGTVDANPYIMNGATAVGPNVQHFITTPGTDPVVPAIQMTNPNGGGCSVQLGDGTGTGGRAASLTQTFLVDNSNAVYTYSYALILEDPSGHTTGEKPFFKVNMYDELGNSINCADYSVIAGPVNSGGDPDFVAYAAGFYLPWRTTFAPLQAYIGQNVTIEFIIGDCSQSGHYGYGYVDAECSPIGIIASDSVICGNSTVNLTAPAGAATYTWSTGETTQNISVNNPGTYSVDVTPVTGSACATTLTITVGGSPGEPTAVFTANPTTVCIGETINFTDNSTTTLGAVIDTWDWDFGDGNTSNVQNPSHTYGAAGNYTVDLTVTTQGGCTDNITTTITVNAASDPTITPAGPYCSSDAPAVMTAVDPGGTWSSVSCGGCINASTGSFDPGVAGAGTHDVIYTIGGFCASADTISVLVESITIDNVQTTDPLCAGSCDGSITITATGAVDYSIDGGTTWQANGTFTLQCAGNYTATVRSATGCLASQPVTLVDPPQLTMSFSAFDVSCNAACDGSAIVIPFGGTAPHTFSWDGAAPSGVAQANGLCASPTHTIVVTDANGCFVDSTFVINEPPPIVINNVTTTDETCLNSCDGSIVIDAPLAVNYSIDNGLSFQPSNTYASQCSGTYNIVVEDVNGCPATTTATINSPNAIILTTSQDTTVCIGGTANLAANASGGTGVLTYNWDNNLPSQASHVVNPTGVTVYNVFVTDANGCQTPVMPVVVQLFPPLNVQALSDQDLCLGEEASISAIASGGNGGPYTYNWDNGLGTGQSQSVSPQNTTVYTVTASDNCETPDVTASVTITVNPLPDVLFSGDNLEGCLPVGTTFSNDTDPNLVGNSCIWDFGDGSPVVLDCGNPSHTYTEAGCYDVTLIVTSPEGCVSSNTIPDYVCVRDYPVADFQFGPQPTTVLEPEITFVDMSTNPSPGFITTHDWSFAELGYSTDQHPVYEFPSNVPGEYEVCLEVTNNFGCADNICQTVIIEGEFLVYVPNAFTPDGDGINEVFTPLGQGLSLRGYEFMVFNRWGQQIFSTDSPDVGWDGTYKGSKVKQEVYVWKLNVRDEYSGEKHELYGHVSVLR